MGVVPAVADQRSHLILVLSEPRSGEEAAFEAWYIGGLREHLASDSRVLAVRPYRQDEVDVTHGRYPLPRFRHLSLVEVSVDGGEDADDLLISIATAHRQSGVALEPATWLYHPISETAGADAPGAPGIVVAFANGIDGREAEFREWYSTRHIRHALYIPVLVSGQCFERSGHQRPGSAAADYQIVAVYASRSTAAEFLDAIDGVDHGLLAFPAMDTVRFAEAAFRLLA